MSTEDVLTLVIASLALLVALSTALYDRSKDRPHVEISFAVGTDWVEVSVVNAGHRPLYVMHAAFAREDGGLGRPLLVRLRLIEERIKAEGRGRVLQPWEPLQFTVPAEMMRTVLADGYTQISVRDSRGSEHQERVPDWVLRKLDEPPGEPDAVAVAPPKW